MRALKDVDLSKESAEDRAAHGRLHAQLRLRCGATAGDESGESRASRAARIIVEHLADGSIMVTAIGEREASPKRFTAFSSSASAPTLGEALCDAARGLGIDL